MKCLGFLCHSLTELWMKSAGFCLLEQKASSLSCIPRFNSPQCCQFLQAVRQMSDHFLPLVKHHKATFYKALSHCTTLYKISKAIGRNACLGDTPLFQCSQETLLAEQLLCCLYSILLNILRHFKPGMSCKVGFSGLRVRCTAGLPVTWWLSSQKFLPWLRYLSDICWDARKSRKEQWQKEVQGESVLSLFLSETNKQRLEKWDIFSLLKNLHALLVFNLQASERSRLIRTAFPCGNARISVTGCKEQTEMNLQQTDVSFLQLSLAVLH